jgi:hypothetical protein
VTLQVQQGFAPDLPHFGKDQRFQAGAALFELVHVVKRRLGIDDGEFVPHLSVGLAVWIHESNVIRFPGARNIDKRFELK